MNDMCKLMHRFLDELEPLSDREIELLANHIDHCKPCKLQAMGFVAVMRGY